MIRFIRNHPALFITEGKILTIADLHIGKESEIYTSGISIPSQTEKLKKETNFLIKLMNVKTLIILGDLKHKVPGISFQEFEDISKMLKYLSKKVKIIICRGNHDSGIENLVPKNAEIFPGSGFKIGKIGFCHGQSWIDKELMNCEILIMGHVHPAVNLKPSGFRMIEQCWLKCEIDREKLEEKFKRKCKIKFGIVIPAFNHLIGGTALNEEEGIGPLFTNEIFKWKNGEVFLKDGTCLGRLDSIF